MSSRRVALAVFAASVLLALPSPALACRILVTPNPFPVFPKVVVVRIKTGGFAGDQSRFYQWKARARVKAAVAGTESQKMIDFGGAFESSGCQRTQSPPKPGETWVLFYNDDGLRWSFPLDRARGLDPRVAAYPVLR